MGLVAELSTGRSGFAVPWRTVGLGLLGVALFIPNLLLLRESLATIRDYQAIFDWNLIVEAHDRIGTGTMYDWSAPRYVTDSTEYLYRYSPVLPYLMGPIIEYGLAVWRVLHAVVLLALPGPIAVIALLSGPFWFDVAHGNFLAIIAVAGWLALRGNRWGMGAYFALALLIPRPLMVPLLVWLLWKRPESRPIFAGVAVVLAVATLATGEAFAWLGVMTQGSDIIGTYYDWGPSRFIGAWWLLIGIPLGAWLTWKGRVGLASLAVSPYVLPYYLLTLLWEVRGTAAPSRRDRYSPSESKP